LGEDAGSQLLPADAPLQDRERKRSAVAEREHLAVEHRARFERCVDRLQVREARRDQLLAARPEPVLRAAPPELGADAVPFPFRLPFRDRPERRRILLERGSEEEWIRTREIGASF